MQAKQSRRLEALRRLGRVGEWLSETEADGGPSDQRSDAGTTIYVYDTDILVMYSDPKRVSHYCALLRDGAAARRAADNKGGSDPYLPSEELLASILGNHIVWGRQDRPALNCPAHADELIAVATQVYLKAIKEINSIQEKIRIEFESIDAEFKALTKESKSDPNPEWLPDRLLKLMSRQTPRLMEGIRLNKALIKERAYSIENFRLPKEILPNEFFPSAFNEKGEFQQEIIKLSEDILKILVSASANSDYKIKKFRSDALALAHMCWLNNQLILAAAPANQVQVRFVTGAPHLHSLISKKTLVAQGGEHEGMVSKLRALIRHPLGLIDEIKLSDDKIVLLLESRMRDGSDSSFSSLPTPEIDQTEQDSEDDILIKEILNELEDLLRATQAHQYLDLNLIKELINSPLSNKTEKQIPSWISTLSERIDYLRKSFFANLFVLQSSVSNIGSVARNLPPLNLRNQGAAYSKFCQRLYRQHASVNDIKKSIDLGETIEQIISESNSDCKPLLAAALWRAAEKNWPQACILAKSAFSLVDQSRAEKDDAAYLYAVALRITAGANHDRNNKSDDSFASDIKKSSGLIYDLMSNNIEADLFITYKYKSELISIRSTEQLQNRLIKSPDSRDLSAERKIFYDARDLANEIVSNISDHKDIYSVNYSLQQCYIAMAHMVLLDRYSLYEGQIFPLRINNWSKTADFENQLINFQSIFHNHCLELKSLPPGEEILPVVSSLVSAIDILISLEVKNSAKLGIKIKNSLREEMKRHLTPAHHVTTIDPERFNFMEKISNRHLS